jgi:hypothetical protein
MKKLSKLEKAFALKFLESLSRRYADEGGKDVTLDDTPKNREFCESADAFENALTLKQWKKSDGYCRVIKNEAGKLVMNNSTLVNYVRSRIEKL